MKNILIVDDETVQLETLRRGLKTRGYGVLEAESGTEALEKIEKESGIDLVLTDYAMPGMNGINLLEKIREKYHILPVIIMTAYGNRDIEQEARRLKCNGLINKPFSLDELMETVRQGLKHDET